MFSKRHLISLAVAVLVTIPLIYFSFSPIYLIHVYIQPRKLESIHFARNKIETYKRSRSSLFFDFDGFIDDQSITRVFLSVRPVESPEWFKQGDGYNVAKGFFSGTVQLGSSEWPVTQDERYSFKLTSSSNDGLILAEGDIDAHVRPVSGSNPFLIAAIGLVASILQIVAGILNNKKTWRGSKTKPNKS